MLARTRGVDLVIRCKWRVRWEYGRMDSLHEWTFSHFLIANPRGRTQGNLPLLLRRLATEVAALGKDAMILDVTISDEITDRGPWWGATVYYNSDGWKDGADGGIATS